MIVLHRPLIIGFCDETVPVKRGISQVSSRFRIMPAGNEPGRLLPSSQHPPAILDRLQGKVSRDMIPCTSSRDISHLPARHPAHRWGSGGWPGCDCSTLSSPCLLACPLPPGGI